MHSSQPASRLWEIRPSSTEAAVEPAQNVEIVAMLSSLVAYQLMTRRLDVGKVDTPIVLGLPSKDHGWLLLLLFWVHVIIFSNHDGPCSTPKYLPM